jgi:hypothetical protein
VGGERRHIVERSGKRRLRVDSDDPWPPVGVERRRDPRPFEIEGERPDCDAGLERGERREERRREANAS